MERRVSNPLVVRDLGLKRGDRIILDGVTFEVEPGELCALMGASGAGKSTILRAIAALEPFDAGTVMLDEAKLVPGPVPPQSRLKELRRHVGFVFQAPSLFEHMTALDNVMLALVHALRWPRDKSERVAAELLESLGRRWPLRRVSARALGRRGATRGDRAGSRPDPPSCSWTSRPRRSTRPGAACSASSFAIW
jgi:ABC-type transporter Mla maintaining outer membrane lipid asymmetry ATPase subunit MlaF